jgi:hypothetical protein
MKRLATFAPILLLLGVYACNRSSGDGDAAVGTGPEMLRALRPEEVLGALAYGETSRPTPYSNPPRYRAYFFVGVAGDSVDLWARSSDGDAVMWLATSTFKAIAFDDDADASTHDAHIATMLPESGTFYVVFRERDLEPATFSVTLAGSPANDAGNAGDAGDTDAGARDGSSPDTGFDSGADDGAFPEASLADVGSPDVVVVESGDAGSCGPRVDCALGGSCTGDLLTCIESTRPSGGTACYRPGEEFSGLCTVFMGRCQEGQWSTFGYGHVPSNLGPPGSISAAPCPFSPSEEMGMRGGTACSDADNGHVCESAEPPQCVNGQTATLAYYQCTVMNPPFPPSWQFMGATYTP